MSTWSAGAVNPNGIMLGVLDMCVQARQVFLIDIDLQCTQLLGWDWDQHWDLT